MRHYLQGTIPPATKVVTTLPGGGESVSWQPVAVAVPTPWATSTISVCCTELQVRLSIAEHFVTTGREVIHTVDLTGLDASRSDLPPVANVDRRRITRVPIDANDTMQAPATWLAWWDEA